MRLCMLTGARSGEARTAISSQFNLDLAIWTKQAVYTKQHRVLRLQTSHEAVALIRLLGDNVLTACPFLLRGYGLWRLSQTNSEVFLERATNDKLDLKSDKRLPINERRELDAWQGNR